MPETASISTVSERNEEFLISEPINVGGLTSDLRTRIKVNCEKGTFKITSEINTKHVNPAMLQETEAMVERLRQQIWSAIAHASARREYWLMENGDGSDPDQLSIGFESED